jgi:hypothetical protein
MSTKNNSSRHFAMKTGQCQWIQQHQYDFKNVIYALLIDHFKILSVWPTPILQFSAEIIKKYMAGKFYC